MPLYLGRSAINNVAITFTNPDGTTNTNTSDATLSSGNQMLQGVTAYSNGQKYTGQIPTKTDSNVAVSGNTVTVPSGYYASEVKKTVATASVATPSISVSSAGLITASVTQSTGYVTAGTKSATQQLTVKSAETITPGTSDKTIASGQYLTGTQTIKGDANLVAGNIISGKSIFGVSGNVVIQKYYTGSTEPASSLGSNGDIYLKS